MENHTSAFPRIDDHSGIICTEARVIIGSSVEKLTGSVDCVVEILLLSTCGGRVKQALFGSHVCVPPMIEKQTERTME